VGLIEAENPISERGVCEPMIGRKGQHRASTCAPSLDEREHTLAGIEHRREVKTSRPNYPIPKPHSRRGRCGGYSVRLEKASISDQDFLQSEIENSQLILPNKIESLNTDGAYNSLDNQKFCKENNITLYLSSLQSKTKRFELEPGDENSLMVLDLKTNIKHQACIITNKNGEIKWRIIAEGTYRYFTKEKVDNFLLRKNISQTPKEMIQRRNNVEASIFQLSYHCKNSKTRYRGICKNRNWAILRTIWINFSRIKINLEKHMDSLLSNYSIFTSAIKYDLIVCSYLFSKIFKLDNHKHSQSSWC